MVEHILSFFTTLQAPHSRQSIFAQLRPFETGDILSPVHLPQLFFKNFFYFRHLFPVLTVTATPQIQVTAVDGASSAGTELEIVFAVGFYFITAFQTADLVMNNLFHKIWLTSFPHGAVYHSFPPDRNGNRPDL